MDSQKAAKSGTRGSTKHEHLFLRVRVGVNVGFRHGIVVISLRDAYSTDIT